MTTKTETLKQELQRKWEEFVATTTATEFAAYLRESKIFKEETIQELKVSYADQLKKEVSKL